MYTSGCCNGSKQDFDSCSGVSSTPPETKTSIEERRYDMPQKQINEYEFTVDMCIGYTSKGEMFLIDIEDYDKIKEFCWHFDSKGYVTTNVSIDGKQKKIRLHRLIMDFPDGMVDHIHSSESKYDNRKSNLRICTNQENQFNRGADRRNKLGIKGVSRTTHGNKYQAQIQIDGKLKYLGSYQTIKEAADAYDMAALKYFGEFAFLNNYNECA